MTEPYLLKLIIQKTCDKKIKWEFNLPFTHYKACLPTCPFAFYFCLGKNELTIRFIPVMGETERPNLVFAPSQGHFFREALSELKCAISTSLCDSIQLCVAHIEGL